MPYKGGNENDIYFNEKEQSLYKVNNLFNSDESVVTNLRSIADHNKIFLNSPYELIGFTGFDGRSVYPIYVQKFVHGIEATPQQIDNYMMQLGFKKSGDFTYTNGQYKVSDLRPRNVLVDRNGDVYVIDDIIRPYVA